MAIPWLIGALAVAAGAAIVKKLNEDDDSSSSNDYESESKRHEEAESERAEKERQKKLDTARENFARRGERFGSDIAQSLEGWIDVKFEQSPAFLAKLNENGFADFWGGRVSEDSSHTSFGRQQGKSFFYGIQSLNSKGVKTEQAIPNEHDISALITSSAPPFEKIRENLKIYADTYSVKLTQGVKLVEAGEEIEMVDSELKQIRKLKAKISRLQSHLSAQL
ncbi:MAG: hypothetical protein U1D25_14125 [Hydrogenophaga sp.]|uniref:hypothetical protein n=1 Tax=Hydrogenophaga sp. TaxID=1904254 RepID=UPI002AB88294|nr:hypothetical protein [Hydrogenophaga sp.]MDZ4189226.1 hypothetical protein [Hydrogenophaga sp.]